MSHHTGLIASVKRKGYRMTPQREMILDALHEKGHVTADDIYQRVRAVSPAVNLATVYRTLELLKQIGIVTAIDTGDGCVNYELAGEQPHHHLVCQVCGHAIELDCDALLPLQRELCRRYGFTVNLNHLALFGTCPACQKL